QLVGVAAEAGGDPVDRFLRAGLLREEGSGTLDRLQCAGVQFDRCATGHGHQLVAGQRKAIQVDRLHAPRSCNRRPARPASSTSNWVPLRRSFTDTTPRAASSLPRITTKRTPAL